MNQNLKTDLNVQKSIVDKVRQSILRTSVVAVTISGLFAIASTFFLQKDNLIHNIVSIADVVGFNMIAPIVFDDPGQAGLTLRSLGAVPGITDGTVFTITGEVFARFNSGEADVPYQMTSEDIALLGLGDGPVLLADNAALRLVTRIEFDHEVIGYLAITAGLSDIYKRLALQSLMLLMVLGGASLIAYFSGARMQGVITGPISELSAAMRAVSESNQYEIRLQKRSEDEIGVLVDGFNNMLHQIHERDERLAAANDELEATVIARTVALESANRELSSTLSEIKDARDKAQAANESKSAFLATMSHEIRTPINGFLGNTELLLNEDLGERARSYGEVAYRSGEALLDIINDILDFSRIEAGKLEFVERVFSFGQLVQELCTSLSPVVAQKQLQLMVDLERAPHNLVVGDQGRIRQVISNLVTNAVKFTSQGSIVVRVIETQKISLNSIVRVEVLDTGIGIAPELIATVFDRFEQIDNSFERVAGGTGLGLTICRELVTRMGGHIACESRVGVGSTFSIEIPMAAASEKKLPLLPGQDPDRNKLINELAGQPCRVLVVDDSVINRDMACNMLLAIGAVVQQAADGREAIEKFECDVFDLVLMDCQMPEIDGFRATRRIRAIEREHQSAAVYVVALTANAIKGDRERCLAAGMNDYLAKPFKMDELRSQVVLALENRIKKTSSPENMDGREGSLDLAAIRVIHGLQAEGSPHLLERYITIYRETAPRCLTEIALAIEANDYDALGFASHSLKSESASLGATRLCGIAKTLEENARLKTIGQASVLLDCAYKEFEQVLFALEQLLAGENRAIGSTENREVHL